MSVPKISRVKRKIHDLDDIVSDALQEKLYEQKNSLWIPRRSDLIVNNINHVNAINDTAITPKPTISISTIFSCILPSQIPIYEKLLSFLSFDKFPSIHPSFSSSHILFLSGSSGTGKDFLFKTASRQTHLRFISLDQLHIENNIQLFLSQKETSKQKYTQALLHYIRESLESSRSNIANCFEKLNKSFKNQGHIAGAIKNFNSNTNTVIWIRDVDHTFWDHRFGTNCLIEELMNSVLFYLKSNQECPFKILITSTLSYSQYLSQELTNKIDSCNSRMTPSGSFYKTKTKSIQMHVNSLVMKSFQPCDWQFIKSPSVENSIDNFATAKFFLQYHTLLNSGARQHSTLYKSSIDIKQFIHFDTFHTLILQFIQNPQISLRKVYIAFISHFLDLINITTYLNNSNDSIDIDKLIPRILCQFSSGLMCAGQFNLYMKERANVQNTLKQIVNCIEQIWSLQTQRERIKISQPSSFHLNEYGKWKSILQLENQYKCILESCQLPNSQGRSNLLKSVNNSNFISFKDWMFYPTNSQHLFHHKIQSHVPGITPIYIFGKSTADIYQYCQTACFSHQCELEMKKVGTLNENHDNSDICNNFLSTFSKSLGFNSLNRQCNQKDRDEQFKRFKELIELVKI